VSTPFPTLSRKASLKTRETTLDPTLRDSYENGMESTRARYTRRRRQWDVTIDHLTPADIALLDSFVTTVAVYGAQIFTFPEYRFYNPAGYQVRFSALPAYSDDGNVEGQFRQNCTFQIREV
jgi:hypothetical protein